MSPHVSWGTPPKKLGPSGLDKLTVKWADMLAEFRCHPGHWGSVPMADLGLRKSAPGTGGGSTASSWKTSLNKQDPTGHWEITYRSLPEPTFWFRYTPHPSPRTDGAAS